MAKLDPSLKTVAYIHGLNSSSRSFAYLLSGLPNHNVIEVNYNSHQLLEKSLDDVLKQLPKGKLALVGHSLGGLIAALLASDDHERFTELITISAPLAGSKAAGTLRWVPGFPPVLESITQRSKHVLKIADMKLPTPTLSIISTSGHLSAGGEANDSVVTLSSQKALSFGRKQEVKANHFEVLMHERTTELVQKHLFGDKK